jgi:hypothetical protein
VIVIVMDVLTFFQRLVYPKDEFLILSMSWVLDWGFRNERMNEDTVNSESQENNVEQVLQKIGCQMIGIHKHPVSAAKESAFFFDR